MLFHSMILIYSVDSSHIYHLYTCISSVHMYSYCEQHDVYMYLTLHHITSPHHPYLYRYYLRSYCWLSIYTVALLHEGFGFPKHKTPIRWTKEIRGNDLTYALGAMLYEVNQLPWRLSRDYLALGEKYRGDVWVWVSGILGCFMIGLITLVVYLWLRMKDSEKVLNAIDRRQINDDLNTSQYGSVLDERTALLQ